MKLSVFMIASHEEAIFKRCFTSAIESLPQDAELLVLLNGEQPDKLRWLNSLGDVRIFPITSLKTCVSKLRNRAFTDCTGDLIHFIDDDVVIPTGHYNQITRAFESDASLAILGGPNITPSDSTHIERLTGAVLTSPFAAPFVYNRYARHKTKLNASGLDLIFCNLAIRRSAIPKSLRFFEGLYPNEETLFLHRAGRLRLKIVCSSEIYVFHYRRKSLLAFGKQLMGFGRGRGNQTIIDPLSFPLPFVYLIGSAMMVMILGSLLYSWVFPFSLYLILACVGWLYSGECRMQGVTGFVLAPFLSLFVQGCYFVGFIQGFFGILFQKRIMTSGMLRAAGSR